MRVVHARAGAPTEQRTATFTGTVFADPVLPPTDGVVVNSVTFAPGARTHWHTHETGQLLLVTVGAGYAQVRGEDPVPIRAGDSVWIPADEEHWHGAGPDSLMTHTAVSLGETRWLAAVTDDEYVNPQRTT